DVHAGVRRIGRVRDVEEVALRVDDHHIHHPCPAFDRWDVNAGEGLAVDDRDRRLLEAAGGEQGDDGERQPCETVCADHRTPSSTAWSVWVPSTSRRHAGGAWRIRFSSVAPGRTAVWTPVRSRPTPALK